MGTYIVLADENVAHNGGDVRFDTIMYRKLAGTYAERDETWQAVPGGTRQLTIAGEVIQAVYDNVNLDTDYKRRKGICDAIGEEALSWRMEVADAANVIVNELFGGVDETEGVLLPVIYETLGGRPLVARIKE